MTFKLLMVLTLFFAFEQAGAYERDSIYNLKSSWTNQNGENEKLSILKGRPLVLAMIYTSCKGACPLIVSDMQKIERELSPELKEKTRFVLISFDPDADTPVKLKEFASSHALDLKRWTLLHGSKVDIRELANVLDVRYKKSQDNDFEHSNVITLIDSSGVVKFQQLGLSQDPKGLLNSLRMLKN